MTEQRIGIIDIGSNSIRLVIYERTALGAYRVVDSSKQAGRLSDQIDEEGRLNEAAVQRLVATLRHFRLLCQHHGAGRVRTVATAAIRNAVNRDEVVEHLQRETGMDIEILSGEQEAAYGFLGMINTMGIRDGFLIDIGGGSTELSLFRDGSLMRSFSFPFGCVNLAKAYTRKGMLEESGLQELEAYILQAIDAVPWIKEFPDLPLVGVGGTVRSAAKIQQAKIKYPLPLTHNYEMAIEEMDSLFGELRSLPLDKRKKTPGLSKDRADLIVPGLAILRCFSRAAQASHYLVCGAGLRDGLFYDSLLEEGSRLDNVLEYSIANLQALYPDVPHGHVGQVNRLAMQLYETLRPVSDLDKDATVWLHTASSLFRIGASIDYYHYAKHTFYLMTNSRLNGLSHRGIILAAAIASYKNKSGARHLHHAFQPPLLEQDLDLIYKLGTLLQLAIALDRSKSQLIMKLDIELQSSKLLLTASSASAPLDMERKEVETMAADFKKVWGLIPTLL
ncbi:Ppx/GppA phosphatase family protein [Paenibacillus tarimensis]|uniref:Ppx/GppA phosphatase family protein n=1 Tax=Paenibacillus tarimensis TaxID=416012 RepID=UPI001F436BEB|nr:Ppx/GppA phosphatase family protein [Paenibacillus tarimensis]MCF2943900.1 Ppx/GppA family phosphatase [Paenibacillus tarimensis]